MCFHRTTAHHSTRSRQQFHGDGGAAGVFPRRRCLQVPRLHLHLPAAVSCGVPLQRRRVGGVSAAERPQVRTHKHTHVDPRELAPLTSTHSQFLFVVRVFLEGKMSNLKTLTSKRCCPKVKGLSWSERFKSLSCKSLQQQTACRSVIAVIKHFLFVVPPHFNANINTPVLLHDWLTRGLFQDNRRSLDGTLSLQLTSSLRFMRRYLFRFHTFLQHTVHTSIKHVSEVMKMCYLNRHNLLKVPGVLVSYYLLLHPERRDGLHRLYL